jgi:hypothetical protein
MSIISEPFYACKCDNCGRLHENYDGISFWNDENVAGENAMDSDWQEIDGKDYCDLCYTMTDDDVYVINTERTGKP